MLGHHCFNILLPNQEILVPQHGVESPSPAELINDVFESFHLFIADLSLVTTFTIPKTGSDCSWLPASDPAMRDNRLFMYALHKSVSEI